MAKFNWPDPPRDTAFPVARAGYPLIFTAAFVTAVFAFLELTVPALMGLVVTLFVCYFFRDPDRVVPNDTSAVLSPADGKVIWAGTVDSSPCFQEKSKKVSIFMSIFNVHVNRVPFDGKVQKVSYHPGKFFSANLDKALKHNEHNVVYIKTEDGKNICVVQIAGLIARRIICRIQPGDTVVRGQRFGLICFGSRLDIYLPPEASLKVTVGDKVKAGTSVLGDIT